MKESEIRPQQLFNRYLELAQKDIEIFFSDHSRFKEVDCPGCGSEQREAGLEKFKFKYMLCSDCGSLYLSPRPSVKMYERYYRESDSVRFWSTHFFKETAEARRQKIFRPRALLVAEWAKRCGAIPDDGGLFVDIGSGYGRVLDYLGNKGFTRVFGLESNLRYLEKSHLTVVCGKGEQAPFNGERFGAIFLIGLLSYILEDSKRVRLLNEIHRIFQSRSWRFTAPFRKLHQRLAGIQPDDSPSSNSQ